MDLSVREFPAFSQKCKGCGMMPTNQDTSRSGTSVSAGEAEPCPPPDRSDTVDRATPVRDGTTSPSAQAGPDDTMLLIADDASAPPMRCPEPMWAILVGEVDIDDAEPDYLRAVTWFSGSWVERYPATGPYDGDVVVRLTDPEDPALPLPRDAVVDVEMLLAHHGRWRRVGHWPAADHRWPHLIADTAATVMCLHGETGGTAVPDRSGDVAAARPARAVLSRPRRNNSLLELVVAGLLSPGTSLCGTDLVYSPAMWCESAPTAKSSSPTVSRAPRRPRPPTRWVAATTTDGTYSGVCPMSAP